MQVTTFKHSQLFSRQESHQNDLTKFLEVSSFCHLDICHQNIFNVKGPQVMIKTTHSIYPGETLAPLDSLESLGLRIININIQQAHHLNQLVPQLLIRFIWRQVQPEKWGTDGREVDFYQTEAPPIETSVSSGIVGGAAPLLDGEQLRSVGPVELLKSVHRNS